jgi:hypothetical protein
MGYAQLLIIEEKEMKTNKIVSILALVKAAQSGNTIALASMLSKMLDSKKKGDIGKIFKQVMSMVDLPQSVATQLQNEVDNKIKDEEGGDNDKS